MLLDLRIEGLGVVEEALLELGPGLNALTGETGAGKTMVTVAVGLALGARGSSTLVRPGYGSLRVEARFQVPAAARGGEREGLLGDLLQEWTAPGEAEDPGELVVARTIASDGRSGARANGRLAPLGALAEVGARLVEVHGQNQADRLAAPGTQTAFLDRFAGPGHLAAVRRYGTVHAALTRAREALRVLDRDSRERERERDLLSYQVREIEAARPVPGEMARLEEEESRLAHAERILGLVASALSDLGEEGAATDRLRRAARSARGIAEVDPASAALAERLGALAAEVEDVREELRAYGQGVDLDPHRLARVRERLQALRALERKYGDGEEGILSYLREARDRLERLGDDGAIRDRLEREVWELEAQEDALGSEVTARRAEAAPRLSSRLTREVRELGMPAGRVEVALVERSAPGPDGREQVELRFSGGPNQPLLPLARVASGGELSRVVLACRSVLADLDEVPTLVFDEVDAGIGGRAAAAVARRLAALARHRQVLVVTHLPQIAAAADRHFLVTKEGGRAVVRPVEGEERVAEVARMLSGAVTEASLAHARELIEGRAVGGRTGRAVSAAGRGR